MEKLPAGVLLAICVVMLLRLVAGANRRGEFDARVRRTWAWTVLWVRRAWRWRAARREAIAAARNAIRRASAGTSGQREGNVYRPDAFREPRKPH